ncbi:hypothetical protein N9523_07115 [Flavobacteriaceae bacterium]|nr:hypothetical protein [Flavobacteriaceae bacterium]
MKKLILLLLFIPLVSFGQEDVDFDSNLNLTVKDSTKNYFGIGFKVENNEIFDKSNGISDRLYNNIVVIDVNFTMNKFSIGAEYGTNIEGNLYFDNGIRRNLHKFGIRFGLKTLNDKLIFTTTNGIGMKINQSPIDNYQNKTASSGKFYTKFSVILNSTNKLVPEIGIGTDGLSLGFVHFFKPKSSKNKKLKNNEDVYTELKKLNELLELGIITQEEYVKKAEELKKVILD